MKVFFVLLLVMLQISQAYAEIPLQIRGEWQQGGILFGHVEPLHGVVINGSAVKVSNQGDFVFGLGRSAAKETSITVTDEQGVSRTLVFPVKQREYKIQRVEGVKKKHVTPPKSFSDRIAREAVLVKAARTLSDNRDDFLQSFQWPLVGPITGVYGSQRVYNGVPKFPHYGIDIAAPTGTRVRAPAAGLVTLAEPDLFYSGGTLIMDHGHGLSSTFIHLSKVLVKVGQSVQQGQDVAEVGATGRATGPHLDWRMNWFKVRVDPGLLMINTPMNQVSK